MEKEKKWYQSKTKWASIIGTSGAILTIVGGIIGGQISLIDGIKALTAPVTVILGVFGVYDLINRRKK